MVSARKSIGLGLPTLVGRNTAQAVSFYWGRSDYDGFIEIAPADLTVKKELGKHPECLKQFTRAARAEPLEYGVYSACDALVASWVKIFGNELGSVVQSVYLASVDNKVNLLALIKAISMLDYEQLHPHGAMIALASLSHVDIEVVEAGIRAYEHWGNKKGVLALKNAAVRVDWLDEYRVETINYLESM